MPAAPVAVVDSTGAGDAFVGALAGAALERGLPRSAALAGPSPPDRWRAPRGAQPCVPRRSAHRARRGDPRLADDCSARTQRATLQRTTAAIRLGSSFTDVVMLPTHSNRQTAAAAAALIDSMPPGIGIVTPRCLATSAGESPAPSLPIASATRPSSVVAKRSRRPRRRDHHVAARQRDSRRPRREIDILVDLEQEMRALPRAQHLRRPRERAVPRQQHLVDTRGGRRAQHRADVAGILDIVEQQAEIRRRRRRGPASARRRACPRRPATSRARRTARPARPACVRGSRAAIAAPHRARAPRR